MTLPIFENALGVALELPGELTRDDVDVIGTVAQILRTGEGTATVGGAEKIVQAEQLAQLEEVAEGVVKRKRVTYTVLGQELDLGLGEYTAPPMPLAGIHPHGRGPDAPARVEYAPADSDQARFRLIDERGDMEVAEAEGDAASRG